MNKKTIAAIIRYWKAGRNIWEISQLTGADYCDIMEVTRNM